MKKHIRRRMFLFLFGILLLIGNHTTEAAASDGEGYLWRTDWQGNVEIFGVTSLRNATEIVVPAQIEGKKVVKIACNTFTECRNLKRVELPATVRELEDTPFFAVDGLEEIVVAEDNPYYVSVDGCVYTKDLKTLCCVPGAYKGEFVVEPWVMYISGNAMSSCKDIESICLSYDKNYTDEGLVDWNCLNTIFNSCSSLKEINVAEEHPNFSSIDGVLFSKDGKRLITVPAAYEETIYIVPERVEELESYCFEFCTLLEKVVLPEGLKGISEYVFKECPSLREVEIPEGVEYLDKGVFRGCVSLKSVSLPSTVNRIAEEVFDDCVSLVTIEAHGNEAALWQAIENGTAWKKDEEQTLPGPDNNDTEAEKEETPVTQVPTQAPTQAPTQVPEAEPEAPDTEPQADWLIRQRIQKGATLTFSYQVTIDNKVIITGLTEAAEKEKQMRRLVIPQKISGMQVVGIDGGAFARIPLTEVTLPEGLLEIGKGAFYGCNLTEINIPESVGYIAPRAFGANYGLKKIYVPEGNQTYCSVNGVLYTKQMTMLCQVPANYKVTTFVLPDTVKMIEEYAFGNNRHIVEVYSAKGMPECREKAFWNMANYAE